MRRKTWLGLALTGVALIGYYTYGNQAYSQTTLPSPGQTPLSSPRPQQISAMARLEPAGKVIKLQVSAPRQLDRVVQWYVQEGDRVHRGQKLARLDGALRAEKDWDVARSRVLQAQARLEQVLAGSKSGEIARQQGEIQRLQAELQQQLQLRRSEVTRLEVDERLTSKNYLRYRSLFDQGACSSLELEQRELAWNAVQRQLQMARVELQRSGETLRAQIASARGELQRIQEVRPSDVAAAQADIEAAESEARRARVALDECLILAPQSGSLLKILTRPGERIASNGLAELAATDQMVAIAEVYQNDVGRLKLGQTCKLLSPALGEPLLGEVERLGQQVQRQNIFSEQAGERFDQRVVEVRVSLRPEAGLRAARWTNLQLQAVFEAD